MDKVFQPNKIEQARYQHCEQQEYFSRSGTGDPYCILLPPPNVTGSLHMGHAFQHTIMDALIRYHRMKGNDTLWQVGTDHAGIATQMVVERQLNAQGKTRHDLGRDAFVQRIWEWKSESGGTITSQMRRLGASADWSREVFTMDDNLSAAVREVFVQLYDDGLIYRGKRLVNWDPVLKTAISDLEVLNEEENGSLWHIEYPLADGSACLVVATTRPETMLGDTAVAVHPDDQRYQHLIGQHIRLPITGRLIPIIADDYVEQEFGTGCVKITPAHDFNDYEMGKRHDLPMINVFTDDAKINQEAPSEFQGLDRFEARQLIVDTLEELGRLVKTEAHKLKIPRGDRTGAVVEPYLTDQWYVAVEALAKPAIDAVRNKEIRFVPENWDKTYFQWMENIQDWCISRQLWWGHRIPAWSDADGNIYVARDEAEVRSKYQLADDVRLTQDSDVLDTWFSSALWPFATMGWPEKTPELAHFLPSSVLVTGFDIIFFWVARMIMMTKRFTGQIPFKEIYITGLIRDANGDKMSKSKGNVLDPIDVIDGISLSELVEKRTRGMMQPRLAEKVKKQTEKEFPEGIASYGTDALRFTFAALASTSRDINFDLARVEGYRNFCNKLWNASRFVLMNCEQQDTGNAGGELQRSAADNWILYALSQCQTETEKAMANYRFDLAAQALYEFTWNQFCDWYLELCKPILQSELTSDTEKRGTRHTLINTLERLLRLLHPLMPFITDEIWQRVVVLSDVDAPSDSLMLMPYPSKIEDNSALATDQLIRAAQDIEWVKRVITGIRNIRGEMDIAPSKPLDILVKGCTQAQWDKLMSMRPYLSSLSKVASINALAEHEAAPASAATVVDNLEILIPMAGLIDKTAEMARLDKLVDKLEKDIARTQSKLSNEKFVSKAPEAVIDKERTKLADSQSQLQKVTAQRAEIEAL